MSCLARPKDLLLFVAYTERGERVRIISARRATKHEQSITTTGEQNGAFEPRFRAMTDDEVMAAALRDPDARPLTRAGFARMKRVPRAQLELVRRALGLTQEEFAARYRIPLGTLRDWEQGRSACPTVLPRPICA